MPKNNPSYSGHSTGTSNSGFKKPYYAGKEPKLGGSGSSGFSASSGYSHTTGGSRTKFTTKNTSNKG